MRARPMSRRKLSAVDVGGEALAADERIGEIDLDLDPAAVVRLELGEAVAEFDPNRLLHLDVAAGFRERLDAGLVDRVDEGLGAAVHHRHFRPVDLDHAVVDFDAAERRHQMLDGRHRGARDADRRAQIGRADVAVIGRDLAIVAVIEIGPVEVDAAIGLGRVQGHRRRVTAVDTNARQRRAIGECRLCPVTPCPHSGTRPLVFGPRRFRGPTAALGCTSGSGEGPILWLHRSGRPTRLPQRPPRIKDYAVG